jgi:hypothetical protein
MSRLRVPFFAVALAAILLVVLVELGEPLIIGGHSAALPGAANSLGVSVPAQAQTPPGQAIPYLALVDGIALFTLALMGLGLLVPARLHGRLQGVLTLIFSILLLLGAIVLAITAIVRLILMVSLLFAPPFGTIAYLIIWGDFPRGQATVLLGLLMFLKLVFGAALLLAQPRFLQNKGLVALVLTSVLCTIVAQFLQGLVPVILVSILDDIAAIVFAIVGAIWAIVLLIGSIPAIVKAVKATGAVAVARA